MPLLDLFDLAQQFVPPYGLALYLFKNVLKYSDRPLSGLYSLLNLPHLLLPFVADFAICTQPAHS